ncbi:V-type ATP synthase subunit F [Candidatus Woesearchaeota archaeon CG_4_10_14_0_8_um_filter_47_5]|nr:MAG: V-type ATP synthase subunit F [Candidatus Woesearchaeota archaeon CG_4_10_14_0_8_um_filter_47_5]
MSVFMVAGDAEFAVGFRLAGITEIHIVETEGEIDTLFKKALQTSMSGIMVTHERTVAKLKPDFRRKVESSVKPIVVVLSEEAGSQDTLRQLIKKSIGVDLINV